MLAVALVLVSSSASAHFKLTAPASMTEQNSNGSPQKSAPCGLSDSASVMDQSTKTGAVTTVRTGSALTVTIEETITHVGHYRVAIAQTMAELPPDPMVTAVGNDPCGSTTITPNPTMPVLADGLFQHTSAFSGPQTATVQLPAGFTCTNCVVQVIQYMKNHALNNPGGCFYHHCATVTIADDVPVVDGPPGVDEAGGGNTNTGEGGGCCSTQGDPVTGAAGAALIALLVVWRRRRGSSRARR